MKKFLCMLLAVGAVFCLAGCEDGRCDECGRKGDDVKVYEKLDNEEYCDECVFDAAKEKVGDMTMSEFWAWLKGEESK